jgi:hypothetical protein
MASELAKNYLKRVDLQEQPSTRDLVEEFMRQNGNTAEVDYNALGKDLDRLYMSFKQYIKSNNLAVTVHKKGDKLLLRKEREKTK